MELSMPETKANGQKFFDLLLRQLGMQGALGENPPGKQTKIRHGGRDPQMAMLVEKLFKFSIATLPFLSIAYSRFHFHHFGQAMVLCKMAAVNKT